MVARKYAAQVTLQRRGFDTLYDMDLQRARDKLRYEMGCGLISELLASGMTAISLKEEIRADFYQSDRVLITLEAELFPVERTTNYVMPEIPPMHLTTRPAEKPVIEWQCAYCGQTNLLDQHLECRRCGAPRRPMR